MAAHQNKQEHMVTVQKQKADGYRKVPEINITLFYTLQ